MHFHDKERWKTRDPWFADCRNTAWKCCSPNPEMSCCLASGFPVLLCPVITFPQFLLPVFLLFLLWPVTRGSNQDRDPTVPDTTQNLVRPSLYPQKQTESEGIQEMQRLCESFTFFFFGQDTSKPLNSVIPTSLWCSLNFTCVLHWIPCVREAVQRPKRENVGAQHRHCVIWDTMQLISELGFRDPKLPSSEMQTLHLVKCSGFCVFTAFTSTPHLNKCLCLVIAS